ncbi:DUF692 domain-containing protein [Pigmentibacter sp. JX0631]|uniref:DUF692 domain-containing protein n=1 Tax=Pigmentibacter sp. JX0631 TaxID=2976982 RepID=UPI0024697604|nr:DUF692 domain-containing protein [Pigmentibacter sp. JX0631]WGL60241.1 DUF692 domain-containing protein [Pigmentibacter sp. JX0631]
MNEKNIIIEHKDGIFGAGLRAAHYSFWHQMSNLPVLEVMADNYMTLEGGPALYHLDKIRERTKTVMHGVGLNIANAFSIDREYCYNLKKLSDRLNPLVISDHLCFSASPTHNSFDLLPIPFNEETEKLLVNNIHIVQDILQRQLCLENISSYVSYNNNDFTEIEFLNSLCKKTGCGILLDINNIYVSAKNHKFSAITELKKVNPNYVKQYHLAGHSAMDDFLFDTHDNLVCSEVWSLMQSALNFIGKRPVIIERDDEQAPFSEIINEINIGNSLI